MKNIIMSIKGSKLIIEISPVKQDRVPISGKKRKIKLAQYNNHRNRIHVMLAGMKGTFDWKDLVEDVLLSFFLILVSIEAVTFLYWILLAAGVHSGSLGLIEYGVQLESVIFYAMAPFTPVLFTLLLLSWTVEPLRRAFKIKGDQLQVATTESARLNLASTSKMRFVKKHYLMLTLVFSMAVSTFIALYPYSPALNPDRHQGQKPDKFPSHTLLRL